MLLGTRKNKEEEKQFEGASAVRSRLVTGQGFGCVWSWTVIVVMVIIDNNKDGTSGADSKQITVMLLFNMAG